MGFPSQRQVDFYARPSRFSPRIYREPKAPAESKATALPVPFVANPVKNAELAANPIVRPASK